MMQDQVRQVVTQARKSVEGREDHHLILPIRKKLWLAYGPVEMETNNRAMRTQAHAFRAALAINTCEKVLPIWVEYLPKSDIAQRCLKIATDYLSNRCAFGDAYKQANKLAGALDNAAGMSAGQLNALLVGHACNDAIFVALGDNICDDIDDLDEDLDTWDYSMYAAGAYSGGYPFNSDQFRSNTMKLKEFWGWYLSEAETIIGNS